MINSRYFIYPIDSKAAREEHQLAACPITGITATIESLHIPDFCFEYTSPFILQSNVSGLMLQSYKTHLKHLSPMILAGCFLSTLSHLHLISDPLSSIERNLILRDCPTYLLVMATRLLLASTVRDRKYLHSISLEDFITNPDDKITVTMRVQDSINEWTARIYPAKAEEGTATEIANFKQQQSDLVDAMLGESKGKFALPVGRKSNLRLHLDEHKSRGKELLIIAQDHDITIPSKLIGALKEVFKKDSLVTLHHSVRTRLTILLDKYFAEEIAKELKDIINHRVYNESVNVLKQEENEQLLNRAISDNPQFQAPVKLTLAEILANAKNKLANPIPAIVANIIVASEEIAAIVKEQEENGYHHLNMIPEEKSDYDDAMNHTESLDSYEDDEGIEGIETEEADIFDNVDDKSTYVEEF